MKYIRKYDYIRYFTRPKSHWFVSTKKIEQEIKNKINHLTKKYIEDNDSDLDEEEEKDSYEIYKEEIEIKKFEDLDLNDPKVLEGRIIDEKAKEFIISHENWKGYESIDFSTIKENNEVKFKKTIDLLNKKDKIILFQPVFILKNEKFNVINIPDVIIKNNDEITLIEVKATTLNKKYHYLDLFYQYEIINRCLYQNNLNNLFFSNLYLCFVYPEILNEVGKVSFYLNNKIYKILWYPNADSKTNYFKKVGQKLSYINDYEYYDYLIDFISSGKLKNNITRLNFISSIIKNENDQFSKVLAELYNALNNYKEQELNFSPCTQLKKSTNGIKDIDYWLLLKDLYYFSNKEPFCFSGNLYDYKKLFGDEKTNLYWKNSYFSYQKALKDKSNIDINYHDNLVGKIINSNTKKFLSKIKKNIVYFDFESINLAIRVIPNTSSFFQAVNQVSIIVDDDSNRDLSKSINFVIDPIKGIYKENLKQIIDYLYPNDNFSNYSYIVYNKTFEVSRLREFSDIINEQEYTNKVNKIISNIIDIAELFTINKDEKSNYIVLQKLYGYYSIKKVLPLIEVYDSLSYKESKCKNYKTELNISNGTQAQKMSTLRFFKMIDDKEWVHVEQDLKKYCENDVRAMIAIYKFVNKSINNQLK